jgi:hypothetical protein
MKRRTFLKTVPAFTMLAHTARRGTAPQFRQPLGRANLYVAIETPIGNNAVK